ncbi:hypothetical protein R3W88_012661 [Solanum pinnatisectum]|uniref:Gag-pro-like protein n=1 Tax=Solanum pinnatisectum TaxID=50273 RepID=A0AAV9LB10_9SOLN|nr:hypothetical protein R3W88_012661 [Solanum pinnatisectum]
MKQKSNESYREFAYRRRKEAARVRPPMSEKEIVEVFVQVQEPEYYDRIMLPVGAKLAEIVKVGETIEDELRIGKIARVAALPGSLGLLKKKREDVSSISFEGKKTPRKSLSYQGRYRPSQSSYPVYTPIPNYQMGPKPVDTTSTFYRPDQRCAYHSNNVGHDTKDCINLKHKIQDLIDQKVVSLQTVEPNVNSNLLPNHGSVIINMIETDDDACVTKAIVPIAPDNLERAVASLSIKEKKEFVILTPEKVVALGITRSGRCYIPEELSQGVQKKEQPKRPISEAEAEEFWRKMQPKDYSIVKHLEKTPAQISVWDLLMSSQIHRHALIKTLDDSYVPVGTNSDNLAAMINQVIRGHRISFCDEELPFEGRMHNKALHVTIRCQDKIINRVLIDDGSGLNICPLSTLR